MTPETAGRCTFAETAALAQAASRFLGGIKTVSVRHADTPDRAGFHRLYGSHFKTHL